VAGLKGSRASPDMVALLTSREETAELLKMKQSVATRSLFALLKFQFFPTQCLAACKATRSRDKLVGGSRYVDLIIPRGSNDFVQYVMRNTDIPVRD
jgi:gamma-glutamyl phosphate reductase